MAAGLIVAFGDTFIVNYQLFLCLTASYSKIDAAAEAFREEIWPFMGILTS